MFSILKKEIISYFSSLVAYVTIGVFLLVLGLFLWVFPESSILDYGYAGLDSLFSTAPFLFMFQRIDNHLYFTHLLPLSPAPDLRG